MFFNSKRFEIVDLNNQQFLELNKVNTLSFYIKDVLLNTEISSVAYQVVKKTGRDETPVGNYIAIDDITGDVVKLSYTPTNVTAQDLLTFRIKVEDADEDIHILYIDTFNVIA